MSSVPRPLPAPPTSSRPYGASPPTSPHPAHPHSPALSSTASTALIPASAVAASGEAIVCNGCKLRLEETSDSVVVSFGSSLWHVDCRCAKCHNLVEHDTNLLLLSDGSPVCENCSYICSVCSKPISNEAIVTGDESYHADCFRCRSCSNKIEELIFAKTSQGIWCMACHNDRVARSRKHAEAKRTRSIRKDKEGRSSGRRERERSGLSSAPQTGASDTFDLADLPSSASGALDGSGGRHLPPSPYGTGPSSSSSMNNLARGSYPSPSFSGASSQNRRPRVPSSDLPRHPYDLTPDVPLSSSSPSLSSLARAASPIAPTHTHSTSPLANSLSSPTHSRRGSAQEVPEDPYTTATTTITPPSLNERRRSSIDRRASMGGPWGKPSSHVVNGELSSPRLEATDEERSHSPEERRPSLRTYDSHPPAISPSRGPPSPRLQDVSQAGRQGSLLAPAPVDRAANRRSGFYGHMGRPSVEEERPSEEEGPAVVEEERREEESPVRTPSPPPQPDKPKSFLPELHNSMSFYDLDTLLFLNNVGSGPTSPSDGPTLAGAQEEVAVERLASEVPSEDEEGMRTRKPKSEVAGKVRESIRRSKEGPGMQMDVDLVEMLLGELDGTKKEMQDLQSKYNAFRRASRSAFEGFSMARDEYDKEVAARREAEAKMDMLRDRLTEQALTLAAVDKEQKTAEALKRQSTELRTTVTGMEKHLSQLRAEVELSTAQVEELASVDSEDANASVDRSSSVPNHNDIARSLNARLESVKDDHRLEIESLVKQRDALAREVADLRITRDNFAEETVTLNAKNSTLAQQNVEAGRQLELLREAMSKLRAPSPLLSAASNAINGRQGLGHQNSPSASSLSSSVPSSARSPLASSRTISSPTPYDPTADDHTIRIGKPDAVEPFPSVTKKTFKWGKGKTEAPKTPSATTTKAAPPSRPAGSTEISTRSHIFQQTSILRPVRCEYCGDKMWGLNEVRCTACGTYAHAKCAGYLQSSCNANGHEDQLGTLPNGPSMFGNDLTAECRAEDRPVPLVVSKCIGAVEAYGMNYEGIYRKTGGMGQTKLITQYFERGQEFDLEDVDKFNDLAAVTSCMKNFFRSLPDPLFTHDLHEEFVVCVAEISDPEGRLVALEQTLYKLPEPHFITARILIQHLHRVHLRSGENKMNPTNLGVVFGPTLLRSSSASREFSDMGFKAKIIEVMVENTPRLFAKPYPQHDDQHSS